VGDATEVERVELLLTADEEAVLLLATTDDEELLVEALQVRSYSGALLRSVPMMPKDGAGVTG